MRNSTLKLITGGILLAAMASASAQAQTRKESRMVIINNGDTLVNGKKISELDRAEREKIKKDFQEMSERLKESQVEIDGTGIMIERRSGEGKDHDILIRRAPLPMTWSHRDTSKITRFRLDGKDGDFRIMSLNGDSLFASLNHDSLRFKVFKPGGIDKDIRIFKFDGDSLSFNDSAMVKRFRFDFESRIPTMRPHAGDINIPNAFNRGHNPAVVDGVPDIHYRGGRNNSQSFNYSNTDKNGISTRMNIRVSDVSKEDLKTITGSDKPAVLEVKDLMLFPNFSAGKMTLSFIIASKATTQVRVLDSDKKVVFSDNAGNFSGNYVKQLSLPKNGIYYVAVSQNGEWFVKRVVKE